MKKIILFIISFFFLNCPEVMGLDYFYDNFNFKDDSKWNYIQNPEYIVYSSGKVNLEENSNSDYYPLFISNKNNIFNINKNWTLNIKFNYKLTGDFGDGIGIGFTGVDGSLFNQFGIWNDLGNHLQFYYNDFSLKTNNCTDFSSVRFDILGRNYVNIFSNNEWHNLNIEKKDTKYIVYIDENKIYETGDNQCVPTHLWFGNKEFGGRGLWSLLSVDEVKIYDGISNLVTKPKIIILPGLGASWNTDAIVYNRSVAADQWKMTPFVKNYNSLINALEKNGLEKDKDFYVWNYDWRKPMSEIVNNLDNFVDEKIGVDEKVILIGHSLGGLVSRIWAENNSNDSRLEKVINLGSPNLGSVYAYEIWNGGQISDLSEISSIAFKILLKIQGLTVKTDMEAIRRYTPVVKDLLPTFNFITKNGKVLTNDKLETNNSYLSDKNNVIGIGSTLKLFVGNGYKTVDSITLKDNNIFDKILGIWPDGKINKFLYSTSGDGTVLVKSADYGKNDFTEVNSDHGEIVDKTINQVMAEIGLSQVDVITESQNLTNNLVVFIGSPVKYSIMCDNESPVNDIDGFVIIKNNNYEFCNINLIGTGNDLIHVVAGNTSNNNWSYWEKNITNGEINNIKIDPINGQIINNNDDISFLKSIIKTDINSLLTLNRNNKELKESLKNLDKNQPRLLIKNIFNFRMESNGRIISEKIINNTTVWLSLTNKCSKSMATVGFKMVGGYQDLINRLIDLNKNKKSFSVSENAAISYQKMDKILELNKDDITQKDYSRVCANNFVALNYGTEVLIKAHNKDEFKRWWLNDSSL